MDKKFVYQENTGMVMNDNEIVGSLKQRVSGYSNREYYEYIPNDFRRLIECEDILSAMLVGTIVFRNREDAFKYITEVATKQYG